jgi:hypothetical protein
LRSSVQKCLLFSSVLVPEEERREIICTEDRKDHEEEKAGAWSHLFRRLAAQVDRTTAILGALYLVATCEFAEHSEWGSLMD